MSMITEQNKRLRDLADVLELSDNGYETLIKELRQAADTIEQLAAKLQVVNKTSMFSYFDGIADSMKEDAKELEAYQKAFEDIKAEIEKQYKWLMQTKHTLHDIDIAFDAIKSNVDKHNPDKGKERE